MHKLTITTSTGNTVAKLQPVSRLLTEPTAVPVKRSRPAQEVDLGHVSACTQSNGSWVEKSVTSLLPYVDLDFSLCINECRMDTAQKRKGPAILELGDGNASPVQLVGLIAKYGILEELDAEQLAGLLGIERGLAEELAMSDPQLLIAPGNLDHYSQAHLGQLVTTMRKVGLHLENAAIATSMLQMYADLSDDFNSHGLACEVALRHLEYGRSAEMERWRNLATQHCETSARLSRLEAFEELYTGAAQKGLEHLQQAIMQAEQESDVLLLAKLKGDRGSVLMSLGLNQEAIIAFNSSMADLRQCGERGSEATILANIGILRHRSGQLTEARRMYEQSLAIALHLKDKRLETNARQYLGKLLLDMGKTELARDEYTAVLEHARKSGEFNNSIIALEGLGNVERLSGNRELARARYAECLGLVEQGLLPGMMYQVKIHLAVMLLEEGQAEAAQQELQLLGAGCDREEHPTEFAYLLQVRGWALSADRRHGLAINELRQSAELFNELGEHIFEGRSIVMLAMAHQRAGDEHGRQDSQARADALYEALGRPVDLDFHRQLTDLKVNQAQRNSVDKESPIY